MLLFSPVTQFSEQPGSEKSKTHINTIASISSAILKILFVVKLLLSKVFPVLYGAGGGTRTLKS